MIKISINKDKDLIKEIIIKGHANYDEYGKDIVCAAVSSIATTTINDILTLDNKAINYISKDGNMIITNNDSELANKLLQVMVNSFEELADDYPKNIIIGG